MPHAFNKYAKTLNSFFEDMKEYSSDTGFFRFAYQSRAHWMLTCIIGASTAKGIAFESICEKIPRTLISRSSIKNILDNAVKQAYFSKSTSTADKRVQLYQLSEIGKEAVVSWVNRQKDIFNNNN